MKNPKLSKKFNEKLEAIEKIKIRENFDEKPEIVEKIDEKLEVIKKIKTLENFNKKPEVIKKNRSPRGF